MHLIKVDAINSTNSFARELFREDPGLKTTCIVAEKQLQGRGQRGTTWNSNPGENLTFSVFIPKPKIAPNKQFLISALVATKLAGILEKWRVPRVKVKWPNDIMAESKKLGGILIENIIGDGKISGSVIGIGLNVNQMEFGELEAAGSMKSLTGNDFDKELLLNEVLSDLEEAFSDLGPDREQDILKNYRKKLFRVDIPSTFRLPDGKLLLGIIENVSPSGKLMVRTEDEAIKKFDLKEIKLLF